MNDLIKRAQNGLAHSAEHGNLRSKSKTKARLLLAALLLWLTAAGAWAQTTPRLVVWQMSGEKVYYELALLPETTFENGQLVIKCEGKAAAYYQLENILRYTYEGVGSADIDLLPNVHAISVSREGDAVTYRNLSAGTAVSLYTADGMLIDQRTAQNGQPLTLSVANRPSGVYIVKAGKETIKLMKQ